MKRLTVLVLIVAIPTMLSGVYGMNFEFMPELQWKYGYFLAIGLMLVVAGALIAYFKKRKWF